MATARLQCACGKVCGNGGALAMHKKSKTCPLNVGVQQAQVTTTLSVPMPNGVDEITRTQIRNLEIEHELKVSALTEEVKKAKELRVLETKKATDEARKAEEEVKKAEEEVKKAEEEAKKAAELRVLETSSIALEMEIKKAIGEEKITRIRRTGDVYVEHVSKMTQLAVEDAHKQRLLTQCPHLLTKDEMRVYGTPYHPCFDKLDVERYIDVRLALEGANGAVVAEGDMKEIVGKLALRQDSVQIVEGTVTRMDLVPLRSLSRMARLTDLAEMAEEAENSDSDESESEQKKKEESDEQKPEEIEGCRMVMSFQGKVEFGRIVKKFLSLEEVDVPSVNKVLGDLAATASKAFISVVRNRVHVPSVLQDMIDEQCDLKGRKSSHNKYEFWMRKTGGANEHPCETCGCVLTCANFEMGHRVAKAKGGTFNLSNMMVQCGTCNNDQGVLHPSLYKDCKV